MGGEVYVKSDVDALETHRTNVAAADTGDPSASAFWENDQNARYVVVYAEITFTGGTTPNLDLTLWTKPPNQTARMGMTSTSWADLDGGKYAIIAEVHGQDVFVYVDDVTGSPTSFDVDIYIQPV